MFYFEHKVVKIGDGKVTVAGRIYSIVDKSVVQEIPEIEYNLGVFGELARRIISHVYIDRDITDEELSALWDLQVNVFTQDFTKPKVSIFAVRMNDLERLGLIPEQRVPNDTGQKSGQ